MDLLIVEQQLRLIQISALHEIWDRLSGSDECALQGYAKLLVTANTNLSNVYEPQRFSQPKEAAAVDCQSWSEGNRAHCLEMPYPDNVIGV